MVEAQFNDEWLYEVLHEAKVLITSRIREERADVRPSEAYLVVANFLMAEADRLNRSVEGLSNELAN